MGSPEQHLQRAVELDPGFTDARYQLARLQARNGKTDEAATQLAQLLEIEPRHAQAQLLHAELLADAGNIHEARASFETLLEEDPRHATAHYRLGVLHMDHGTAHDAVYHLEKASTLDPDNADAHYRLARLHPGPEDFQKARSLFETAVDYQPTHVEAHFQLGLHLRHGRRYDTHGSLASGGFEAEARDAFETVLDLAPHHAAAHEELAHLLARAGDHADAGKSFAAAIQHDPTRISAYLGLAALQETTTAITICAQALQQDSGNPPVHLRKARLHLDAGDPSAARTHLDQAAEQAVTRIQALQEEANAALEGNQFLHARRLEDHASEMTAQRAEALHQLGLLATDEPNTAQKHFENALATDPEHAGAHHQIAILQHAEGDSQAAIESLRRSVEIEIQNSEAHHHLAQLLQDTGETEMARNHYLITLDLDPAHEAATKALAKLPRK